MKSSSLSASLGTLKLYCHFHLLPSFSFSPVCNEIGQSPGGKWIFSPFFQHVFVVVQDNRWDVRTFIWRDLHDNRARDINPYPLNKRHWFDPSGWNVCLKKIGAGRYGYITISELLPTYIFLSPPILGPIDSWFSMKGAGPKSFPKVWAHFRSTPRYSQ